VPIVQRRREPAAVGYRLVPGNTHHRLIGAAKALILPIFRLAAHITPVVLDLSIPPPEIFGDAAPPFRVRITLSFDEARKHGVGGRILRQGEIFNSDPVAW